MQSLTVIYAQCHKSVINHSQTAINRQFINISAQLSATWTVQDKLKIMV